MAKNLLFVLLFCLPLITNLYAAKGNYRAGLSSIELKPEIGIPLAGYGDKRRRLSPLDWKGKYPHSFFFRPSTGFRDPIFAKTMIIHDENDNKLVLVSLDLIGISKKLVKDIARKITKLGYKRENIIISATHTHSGPGTLSKNLGLSIIAVDLYKRKNYLAVRDKLIKSIFEAHNNLEPVDLYHSKFDAVNVQWNKWRKARREYFNPTAKFILAKSRATKQWLGGMLNFAIHGNAMKLEDTRFSGDIPGAIATATEGKIAAKNNLLTKKPVLLFMNGAEGDVKHKGGRSEDILGVIGNRFASQAADSALQDKNMIKIEDGIKIRTGRAFVGIAGYPLEACYKREGFMKYVLAIVPDFIPLPFPIFPPTTKLTAAKLGHITLTTWPGEASTTLGYRLEASGKKVGHDQVWVIGLANDYLTYFTTESEYHEGEYDSCSSFYGHHGGARIIRKLTKLMKKLD
ncbi:MAG: hypothetical protein HN576_15925 [Bacteriovoracaceae bacterium]|jgi:hypothetical protein|nr:hypothetical protein [Bacteriovoracaceae bacterium]